MLLTSISGLLGGSRILFGLAKEGRAPKIFTRINRFGIPYVAVCSLSLFICLGYMTLSSSASTVFGWLQDLVSVSALINWMIICIVYLRFYYAMKKQGIDRKRLPWKARTYTPGIETRSNHQLTLFPHPQLSSHTLPGPHCHHSSSCS